MSNPVIKVLGSLTALVFCVSLCALVLTGKPTSLPSQAEEFSFATTTAAILPTLSSSTEDTAAVSNPTTSNSFVAANTPGVPSKVKAGSKVEIDPVQNNIPTRVQLAGLPTTVYIPKDLKLQQNIQLIVALHGMNGNGGSFCTGLVKFAEQNHVVLVAPTFNYNQNYKDPKVITDEDVILTAKINEVVKDLSLSTNLNFKDRLLLYGFSRGAQLAHHYAMFYPKQTLGVTVFSGGAYTLPFISLEGKNNKPLAFPYGISDLSEYVGHPFDREAFVKISFNVEVGQNDNDPAQISRAWDTYLGTTRLQRGQYFYSSLHQLGMNAQFTVFPNTGHDVSPAMNATALKFMLGLLNAQVAV